MIINRRGHNRRGYTMIRNGKKILVGKTKVSPVTYKTTRARKTTRAVLKPSRHQTGKTSIKRDRKRVAEAPGKRRSDTGKIYYEYRKNHSDLRGRKV